MMLEKLYGFGGVTIVRLKTKDTERAFRFREWAYMFGVSVVSHFTMGNYWVLVATTKTK